MDAEERYNRLAEKVRQMLEAQRMYFKSNKDFQLLKKSKAIEAEVDAMVNNKQKQAEQQSLFEHLAR